MQGESRNSIPGDLNLLSKCLLVLQDLLHDLIPQVHLRLQTHLIDHKRLYPSEKQIEILIYLSPVLVVLLETGVHLGENELGLHGRVRERRGDCSSNPETLLDLEKPHTERPEQRRSKPKEYRSRNRNPRTATKCSPPRRTAEQRTRSRSNPKRREREEWSTALGS